MMYIRLSHELFQLLYLLLELLLLLLPTKHLRYLELLLKRCAVVLLRLVP